MLPDTCDCGEPCEDAELGCVRCLYLDGTNASEAAVIAALRLVGGRASTTDIMELTGFSRTWTSKVMNGLCRAGRARRLEGEADVFEVKGSVSGLGTMVQAYYELRT